MYLTAKEYKFLEILRGHFGDRLRALSRAELLMALAERSLDDVHNPQVLAAWDQVEKELRWTEDHTGRGGREPKLNLDPLAKGKS